ncbi:MAG: hypothetical protein ACJ8CB_03450 [Ktedonobacteraceae bacterium]
MDQPKANGNESFDIDDDGEMDDDEYDEMELLERLESLREDMENLRVTTLAEVIQRIEEMHRRLDRR